MVDIARPPEVARQRRMRRIAWIAALVVVVAGTTVGLSRLEPAAPPVESGGLWMGNVERGTLLRQVRGPGVLVPDDTRWIPAVTGGRVERILVQPGTTVIPDTVLVELSDPQVEQDAIAAELSLRAARAQYQSLKAELERSLLAERGAAAVIEADLLLAQTNAEIQAALAAKGLVSDSTVREAKIRAQTLATRQQIEQERLKSSQNSLAVRLDEKQADVDQRQSAATLRRNQVSALKVRAGMSGVLQQVPVEVGQRIGAGTNVARVADPTRLKAELRIAETQVKDVAVGQTTEVDTRTGIVKGHVSRIDPASENGTVKVDVVLDDALPRGARPDMNVEGTIELERLDSVLKVQRPASGSENSTVTLFKVDQNEGGATRVPVTFGRSSVTEIEVVRGLNVGDRVVLSDMSAWDGYDRVRFR